MGSQNLVEYMAVVMQRSIVEPCAGDLSEGIIDSQVEGQIY